jgi:hypothetical protein
MGINPAATNEASQKQVGVGFIPTRILQSGVYIII